MTPNQYTEWDLFYIDKSDIVFAYMEKDNPSGFGLCLEIGYARAKGKLVIFVNESDNRYLSIVGAASNVVFHSLSEGISYLNFFSDCTIYLAGGMKFGWQDKIKTNNKIIDPRTKEPK